MPVALLCHTHVNSQLRSNVAGAKLKQLGEMHALNARRVTVVRRDRVEDSVYVW